jgi:Phytoene/squalene synthetase
MAKPMNTAPVFAKAPKETSPQSITAKSKSNFALSFFFLPKNQRIGITNFYALSRVIDDAVDDYPAEQGASLLDFWQEEIRRCYEATPSHPLTLAMQGTIREFKIPRRYLELLLEGCRMDLTKTRYSSFDELYQYCYRVAGVIGLTCMKIFGLQGEEAEQAAEELGIALQLTNILRDVKNDAERGRIYLAQEDIQRYRLAETEVTHGPIGSKLRVLLKLYADRAQYYYDRAFTKMRKLPHRSLLAAWIMGRVYHKLLKKIRARDFDVYREKISVSKPEKILIALAEPWRRR